MSIRILHLLSQRPSLTGSGVTLDVLVRYAAENGYEQHVVVGTPKDDPVPAVGGLPASSISPLRFETLQLPFPVPGMSDVMPYSSTVWSQMTADQLSIYRSAWMAHLTSVAGHFEPDLIHCHHIWLLGAMVKRVFPDVPVVSHSHATGLRQMTLCSHLAAEVQAGCRSNDAFLALHSAHGTQLQNALALPPDKVVEIGAGYREDIFHAQGREAQRWSIGYAGKYSNAKGLPQLLDAVERIRLDHPEIVLHVAGDGAGEQAEALRTRMQHMAPNVVMHGMLSQDGLASMLRGCHTFVLPSFYEGLPLVLIEALACGCRLVCTELPGVTQEISPHLGELLAPVPLPRLIGPDIPEPADLPQFVTDLAERLIATLEQPDLGNPVDTVPDALQSFTWRAVFESVERLWLSLLSPGSSMR